MGWRRMAAPRNGCTSEWRIRERINASGIDLSDRRLATTMARLSQHGDGPIDFAEFKGIVADELLIRLDPFGNSVRGVAFCHDMVDRFTFDMLHLPHVRQPLGWPQRL